MTSCDGLDDGHYHSCHGCHVYVKCHDNSMADDRPCPTGLEFDDVTDRCEKMSSTCQDGKRRLGISHLLIHVLLNVYVYEYVHTRHQLNWCSIDFCYLLDLAVFGIKLDH